MGVDRSSQGERLLIFLLFFGALAIRCFRISDPWWGIESFTSAQFAIFARNFVRYGYLATGFAHVNNVGEVPGLEIFYYMHHPPLFSLLVSLFYRVFGDNEWSTRLVSILLSMGAMGILYAIMKKIWNRRVALFALVFYAFSPLEAYYGRSTIYEMMVLPFVLASVWFYIRWVESDESRYLRYAVMSFIPGGLIDWTAYFVLPALFIHNSFFVERTAGRNVRKVIWFPLTGFILFGLFYLYTSILEGSFYEKNSLATAFFFWTKPAAEGQSLVLSLFARSQIARVYSLMTPVVLFLSLFWILRFLWNLRNRVFGKDSYVILFGMYGLFPTFLLWRETAGHEWLICYFSTALIVSAAISADDLYSSRLPGGRIRKGITLLLLAMFFYFSYAPLKRLYVDYPERSPYRHAVEVGKWIHEKTEPDQRVLLLTKMGGEKDLGGGVEHFGYFPEKFYSKPSPVVRYYADRYIQWGIEEEEELLRLNREQPGYFKFLIIEERYYEKMDESIRDFLAANYPYEQEVMAVFYDLVD